MNQMINNERMRQVRELRGLTQTELAHLVGVNQSAIAAFDAGRKQPSQSLLEAISLQLGFPPLYFRQPNGPDFPLGSLLFRAPQSMTAKESMAAHRRGEVVFEIMQKLIPRVKYPAFRLPRLAADPISAARSTRSELGLSPDRPIPQLTKVIENCGVVVIAVAVQLTKGDAFSVWTGHEFLRPVIVMFRMHSGDRLRYSIAHEVGHLVMHQARQGTRLELELQANQFAAEFLMPEVAMRYELVQPVTLTSLSKLKLRWGVSLQALIKRAHDLGIITSGQYRYLNDHIGMLGWKTEEPKELEIPLERPRALKQIAELLYGRPIDYKKMADDMTVTPTFLEEILEAYAEKGMPSRPAETQQQGKLLSFARQSAL
jgi:Zn-dependent peptidase ImmA (M78 family)/DNA-binding XRE family transcriptional regulator